MVGAHVGPVAVGPVAAGRFTALEAEVARLQMLAGLHAAEAAAAVERARRAEQQLDEVRGELLGLRGELAALREELVWAFAGGKVEAPPRPVGLRTVDLRATGTAG